MLLLGTNPITAKETHKLLSYFGMFIESNNSSNTSERDLEATEIRWTTLG